MCTLPWPAEAAAAVEGGRDDMVRAGALRARRAGSCGSCEVLNGPDYFQTKAVGSCQSNRHSQVVDAEGGKGRWKERVVLVL